MRKRKDGYLKIGVKEDKKKELKRCEDKTRQGKTHLVNCIQTVNKVGGGKLIFTYKIVVIKYNGKSTTICH